MFSSINLPSITASTNAYNPPKTYLEAILEATKQIQAEVAGMYVVTFVGFSALGYEHLEEVEAMMRKEISDAIKEHGCKYVVVSAGVTSDGIGMVYKIANELNVRTIGIVSSIAQEPANANNCKPDKYCNKPIYIPAPKDDPWSVVASEGEFIGSFTLVPLRLANGVIVTIGGGLIAMSEIKEAIELGLPIHNHTEPEKFGPNQNNARKRELYTPEQQNPLHYYLLERQAELASKTTPMEAGLIPV